MWEKLEKYDGCLRWHAVVEDQLPQTDGREMLITSQDQERTTDSGHRRFRCEIHLTACQEHEFQPSRQSRG
jgi:hypothetical protein